MSLSTNWDLILQSVRELYRRRLLAVVLLLISILSVTANVVILNYYYYIALKPLPFRKSDQLVVVMNAYPRIGSLRAACSITNYYELKEGISSFEDIAGYRREENIFGNAASAERIVSLSVTPSFFAVLGQKVVIGRPFFAEDGDPRSGEVAVITESLWRQRFKGAPDVIGKSVLIDNQRTVVVGVLPSESPLIFGEGVKLWRAIKSSRSDNDISQRHTGGLQIVAKLRDGTSLEVAQQEIDLLNQRLEKIDPLAKIVSEAGFRTWVAGLKKDYTQSIRPTLTLLAACALLVVVISTLNSLSLFAGRMLARLQESAVRCALGASPLQVINKAIADALAITAVGGLVGTLLGYWTLRVLSRYRLGLELYGDATRIEPTTLGIIACLVVLSSFCIAAPVGWFELKLRHSTSLLSGRRLSTEGKFAKNCSWLALCSQVALTFVLVSIAGALSISLHKILRTNPGFNFEKVFSAEVSLLGPGYRNNENRSRAAAMIIAELQKYPDLKYSAICTSIPFTDPSMHDGGVWIEHEAATQNNSVAHTHYLRRVGGDYFQTLTIPLKAGRFLDYRDLEAKVPVCVVDEDFAKVYWPNESAIGHRLCTTLPSYEGARWLTIVGVVGSVRQLELGDDTRHGAVYFPFSLDPTFSFYLVTRSQASPEGLFSQARDVLKRVDPRLALYAPQLMEARLQTTTVYRRAAAVVAVTFATIAVFLAAVGIYGSISYKIGRQRREVAIRLALGALHGDVIRAYLFQVMRCVSAGVMLGLGGLFMINSAASALVYHTKIVDPLVCGSATILVALVGLLGAYLPSRASVNIEIAAALEGE